MEMCVRRAVVTIRERYDEPLSLDDLARTATMSKFHFLRSFRQLTGVTPGRFLAAVRIHEAKRLLFSTPLSVAEISLQVGYGSLGTFTRRFTECVGLSPTTYRRAARGEPIPMVACAPASGPVGTVRGTVTADRELSSPIFLGLFGGRIPQGRPVASATVAGVGSWEIPAVPVGTWHLLGLAADRDTGCPPDLSTVDHPPHAGIVGGVRVTANCETTVDITIRPVDWTWPPLLSALPRFESRTAA